MPMRKKVERGLGAPGTVCTLPMGQDDGCICHWTCVGPSQGQDLFDIVEAFGRLGKMSMLLSDRKGPIMQVIVLH